MLIVAPDFDHRITLPGAGPCPRPVDLNRAKTGFATLVSLRVYSFVAGAVIDGEAEDDDVFVILMRGAADIEATQGDRRLATALRRTAAARVLYLPPHASYRLTAVTDCAIVYARAQPRSAAPGQPEAFEPEDDALTITDHAAAMTLRLETIAAGGQARFEHAAERFVHARSDDGGAAHIADQPFGDWDTAVLHRDEQMMLAVDKGTLEILTISAATG